MALFIRNPQSMNLNERRRMQFLAGIISENNMDPLENTGEATASDVDMHALEAMPEIDMAAQMISQNPNSLAQIEKLASMAGIDSNLNEIESGEIELSDIQSLADVIDGIAYGKGLKEEDEVEPEVEAEKPDLMMIGASIGGILPFIPGISGWFSSAAAATGIPGV